MKNDALAKSLASYADVEFDAGEVWVERLDDALVGKLSEGDKVVVRLAGGSYRVGEVAGFRLSSPYGTGREGVVLSVVEDGGGLTAADVEGLVARAEVVVSLDKTLRELAVAAGAPEDDVRKVCNAEAASILGMLCAATGERGVFARDLCKVVAVKAPDAPCLAATLAAFLGDEVKGGFDS